MRPQINAQSEFDFQPSTLKVTQAYYRKYQEISRILDTNPRILAAVHADLRNPLKYATIKNRDGSTFDYSSETVLRVLICQIVEGMSLRQAVVRIDDSHFLRWFVKIYNGPMMCFTTLDKLKNSIRPETWKRINHCLARGAVESARITGDALRLDTTAVETNIHYPTDSSLLWDTYRVLGRLIDRVRKIDPQVVGEQRVLTKKVKKLATKIARQAGKKRRDADGLKPLYRELIRHVEGLCEWSTSVAGRLESRRKKGRHGGGEEWEGLVRDLLQYTERGHRVVDQASRRVLDGAPVPNDEKILSLFEPHTELLVRGKAGKAIEYGHMIQIQQVPEKFITDYAVFEKKPVDYALLGPALDRHKKLFGDYPDSVTADKGYWENKDALARLEAKVALVAIAKKGNRTAEETERETDDAFRLAQRFRAGVEGSISFLKRVLGLCRCYNKGWTHYVATVGATVFVHNLLVLARL
jgi:IS5 family transposase